MNGQVIGWMGKTDGGTGEGVWGRGIIEQEISIESFVDHCGACSVWFEMWHFGSSLFRICKIWDSTFSNVDMEKGVTGNVLETVCYE